MMLLLIVSIISSLIITCQCNSVLRDKNLIVNWFIGDYTNIKQHQLDIKNGLINKDLGGHEHVCSTFKFAPNKIDTIIAQFYFNNNITETFRFRKYNFFSDNKYTYLSISRPTIKAELKYKSLNYNIDSNSLLDNDFESLPKGCDVVWKRHGLISKLVQPITVISSKFNKLSYLTNILDSLVCFRGRLINDTCELTSSTNPNIIIVVKDDLRLTSKYLYINDQVFTKDGRRLIGNKFNIPYKFLKI